MNAQLTTNRAMILAGGLGTRMQKEVAGLDLDEATERMAEKGAKGLIPMGRPFLDHGIQAMLDAGLNDFCLIVPPGASVLRAYYEAVADRLDGATIAFAVQPEPLGTANAVAAGRDWAADRPFLVLNSDNYYPAEALAAVYRQPGSAVALFEWQTVLRESNIPADRLRKFAVGTIDADGCLDRIIEKPDQATWDALPRPVYLSMNCWQFRPVLFEACRAIRPSPRGELEIPSAVQYAMERLGEPVRVVPVRAAVLDLSSRKDVAPVAARLAGTEVRL